jgi:predicted transcriptional regulator
MNSRAKIITEQALSLPVEERAALYHALAESLGLPDASIEEACLDEPGGPYRLSQAEEAAVAEGQAQARRGEFVSDEEVAAFYKRHGL